MKIGILWNLITERGERNDPLRGVRVTCYWTKSCLEWYTMKEKIINGTGEIIRGSRLKDYILILISDDKSGLISESIFHDSSVDRDYLSRIWYI